MKQAFEEPSATFGEKKTEQELSTNLLSSASGTAIENGNIAGFFHLTFSQFFYFEILFRITGSPILYYIRRFSFTSLKNCYLNFVEHHKNQLISRILC